VSDEISDARARSWASKTVEAYARAVFGSTTGLHDHIASAHRPSLFATMNHEEQVDRVNRAIQEWETWTSRPPGPRVASFNEVYGNVELR
jgi:hypothetical protein